MSQVVIDGLDELFDELRARGFRLVGPTMRDGAIVYDDLRSPKDLPEGWTDEQEGGSYRLTRRDDDALFGYAVGPHSWKKFLFPPSSLLWHGERDGDGFTEVEQVEQPRAPFAFIGVRSCELHAIAIQDRVFIGGPAVDPTYAKNREGAFIVALNCGVAGGTCFCVSMETGPKATSGFDLALTELLDGGHRFVVEVGSDRGRDVVSRIKHLDATAGDAGEAEAVVERTAAQMGREMDTTGIKELLYANYDHPRWDDVASRCLTCGNCTMVCPTCFCSTVEDTSDLTGESAERTRVWDSCFTMDLSYIHGGSVRASPRARYRQWMTHKLATWLDQFGSSGCVGCGRCITWCPVGIDITEEVRAIRGTTKEGSDGVS